jgi:hypothetical protein
MGTSIYSNIMVRFGWLGITSLTMRVFLMNFTKFSLVLSSSKDE